MRAELQLACDPVTGGEGLGELSSNMMQKLRECIKLTSIITPYCHSTYVSSERKWKWVV